MNLGEEKTQENNTYKGTQTFRAEFEGAGDPQRRLGRVRIVAHKFHSLSFELEGISFNK